MYFITILRGLGQIMLQRNTITGLLFALGIALHSVILAIATIIGAAAGTLFAKLCKFPAQEIKDGLYGFNSALVALAAIYFYSPTLNGVLVAMLGVVLATLLMRLMQKYRLKPFTFPFVTTTWLAFWLLPQQAMDLQVLTLTVWPAVDGFLQAFGQVMFQANSLTGLIFLIALGVHSRKIALVATLGAALGVAIGLVFSWPIEQVASGIFGYNAVLTVIALAGVSRQIVVLLLGAFLSVVLTRAMLMAGISALTFPFILATWIVGSYVQLMENRVMGKMS